MAVRYHFAARSAAGVRHAFAPQHAKLKQRPRGGERRHVRVGAQRLEVGAIGLVEFAQIREQRAERDPLLPMSRARRALAPRRQHRGEIRPGGLVDRQQEPIGRVGRRAARRRLRKAFSRVCESMRRARDLRSDERGARGFRFDSSELAHERLEAIEGGEVADELRRQLLLFDDQLGNLRLLRRAPEPVPRPLPRAFEIDGGDVARRQGNAFDLEVGRLRRHDHPNRFFRLSRPTFCSVATMVLMMSVGWPSDRYCTRHVTEHVAALRRDLENRRCSSTRPCR